MYKVLLVDDEVLIREAISEIINWNKLGYELVGICQNGKEAKEFISNNSVDMVLTDICMPVVDGIELCEFIYHNFPEISIIIFSGFDEFEYAQKAIKYNVEEYILKPVTAAELSEVLLKVKLNRDKKFEKEEEWHSLSNTLKRNKLYLKSKALSDFITGRKTQEDAAVELKEFDIDLNAKYYKVAIIEINHDFSSTLDNENKQQYSSLMAFAVHNISDETVKDSKRGVSCLATEKRLYILFQFDDPKDLDLQAKNISKDIKNQVKTFLKLDISVIIGNTVYRKEDIYRSYEAAAEILKYKYLFGEERVLDYEDVVIYNDKAKKNVIINNYTNELIPKILANNTDKILKIIDDLELEIKLSLANKSLSITYLQRIILNVDKELHITELVETGNGINKEEVLKEISNTDYLCEGIKLLKDYFYKIANILEVQKDSVNKRRALLAMDFIEKNFGKSDLNLSDVCSYLNISSSRFSTIFKDETGKTFMEALTITRIDKAKILLESTDLKNYEIADKVGFSDPHYFSVVFKKSTGQSPTEYLRDIEDNNE